MGDKFVKVSTITDNFIENDVATKTWVDENFVKKIREKDPSFFMNNKENVGHCEECPRNIKVKDISKLPCGKYVCQVGREQ